MKHSSIYGYQINDITKITKYIFEVHSWTDVCIWKGGLADIFENNN